MKDKLQPLRNKIDEIDTKLVGLLNERTKLVLDIGKVKHTSGGEIYAPDREEAVLRTIVEKGSGPLPADSLRAIYREVMSASLALEKPLVIAYLGPEATYSHMAVIRKFGSSLRYEPLPSITDVFAEVSKGRADYGVVPIENSLYGSVFETYDLLLQNSLSIVNELNLQINHFLLASKKYKLNEIKKVYSHPQALGQCSIFLKTLENADIIPAYDTAGSALITLNDTKTPTAAVASRNASELYGLKILKSNIQNNKENFTRFLVISKKAIKKKFQLKSLPGALFRALSVFALRDINLVKIESRPIPHKPFEYVFYVDLSGSMEDEKVKNAINHLSEISIKLKCFGSYEAGKTFKS